MEAPGPPRDPGTSPGPGPQPTEVPREVPPIPKLSTPAVPHDSIASEPLQLPMTEDDEPELTWLEPPAGESVSAVESLPEIPPIPSIPAIPPFDDRRMTPPTAWDAVRAVDPAPGASRRPEPPIPGYRSGEYPAIPRRTSGERPVEFGAPPGGAIELAQCLEDLARRIRAGEVAAPSYRPGMRAEGALAALLAALLDRRD